MSIASTIGTCRLVADNHLIGCLNTSTTGATTNVINCRSSVTINSSVNGDGSHAGFVAVTRKALYGNDGGNQVLNLTGCVFDGQLLGSNTHSCGGFIGWAEGNNTKYNCTDCVFAPAGIKLNSTNFYTFIRPRDNKTVHVTNSYYTRALGTAQGKQAFRLAKGDGVSSLAISGAGTEYDVSGITAYSNGIDFNNSITTTYGGSGESVSLALTAETRSGYQFKQYAASQGTLSDETTNAPTLTMPAANSTANDVVTISAEYTKNEVTLVDGTNPSASELTNYEGLQCDVTYTREFTSGTTSTVCLPFAYTKQGTESSFYEFTDITKEGDEYVATMTEPVSTTLTANTPYLFTPATSSVTFTGTIANVPTTFVAGEATNNGWTFKGTFANIEWTSAQTGTYGFSAQDADGISQGQFVKVCAHQTHALLPGG